MIKLIKPLGSAALAALGAATSLAGCQTLSRNDAGADPLAAAPPATSLAEEEPESAPRRSSGLRPTIALAGPADVGSLSADQIEKMFDAALGQADPGQDKAAVCVGMQGANDAQMRDAPPFVVERIFERLRLPAVPASQCGFDQKPFVIASQVDAILYTVRVGPNDAKGVVSFWATAAFGNLGAISMEFRLVRQGGDWAPQPTGRGAVS